MSRKAIAKRNKRNNKELAKTHISELFQTANENKNKDISVNSIKLATNYSQKYKVPISRELKRSFCKTCFTLYTSDNSQIRIKNNIKTITCNTCKTQKRIVLSN